MILLLLTCLNLDLVTVADFSGSVEGHEQFICSGISEIAKLDGEDLRQALITFDYTSRLEYGFSQPEKFECPSASGGTNLHSALVKAAELFDRNSGRVIVIISDGVPDDIEMCLELANLLRASGVRIYGVLINSSIASETVMKQISDVYVSTDYEHLVKEIKKLSFCF